MFLKFGLLLLMFVHSYGHKVAENIALLKPTKESSINGNSRGIGFSSKAVDGDTNNLHWMYCAVTSCTGDLEPWWQVDLQKIYELDTITIVNTITSENRLRDFIITVYKDDPTISPVTTRFLCYQHHGRVKDGATVIVHCNKPTKGRFVRITNARSPSDAHCQAALILCEVKITAVVKNQCPVGFVRTSRSCFWFSSFRTTWLNAQSYCRILGGQLAVADSKKTDSFLSGYLQRLHLRSRKTWNDVYYLGATDLAVENMWTWVDTKDHLMEYSNWAPGQPESLHVRQHCLGMREKSKFKWHDFICTDKNYFICEVKP